MGRGSRSGWTRRISATTDLNHPKQATKARPTRNQSRTTPCVPLMATVLEAIAIATPPFRRSQQQLAAFMARIEGVPCGLRPRIADVFSRSGIEERYSCLADFGLEAEAFGFFPRNWQLSPPPSTAARNRVYRACAPPLAEAVARQALEQAGCAATEITHLLVVSCTGFFAPGLDVLLIQRLGLPVTTERTLIGFMGCNAAFNGLKVAQKICQAGGHDGGGAKVKVLMVCLELCTLHVQIPTNLETVIMNALFGDGAAAVVLAPGEPRRGQLAYLDSASTIADDSLEAMDWEIGDTGFLMHLSATVPQLIERALPDFLGPWFHRHALRREDLAFWAVHPGGRLILDQVQQGLGLPAGTLQESYDVLRQFGNMSSPTILFILKRWMEAAVATPGQAAGKGLALGFGPGLSIEGALFERSDR